MAQLDYVEITLRNGGWDGLSSKQYAESDAHAVASRVVELASSCRYGVTFRCGHDGNPSARDTQLLLPATWMDYRFGNEQGKPIAMADDDRNQIGHQAFNVARVQLHALQLDRQVRQMAYESAQRAQIKQQADEAREQGLQWPAMLRYQRRRGDVGDGVWRARAVV